MPPRWRSVLASKAAPRASFLELPPRLAHLAELVPESSALVDVGTDHARLPLALIRAGRIERALAVDRAPGPLLRSRKAIDAAGLGDRIVVRKSDGLGEVQAGEADVACIAGLGGISILDIVRANEPSSLGIETLIVQPNSKEVALRRGLAALGWEVAREDLVLDKDRFFLTAQLRRAIVAPSLDPEDLFIGPKLRTQCTPMLLAWLEVQVAWLTKRCAAAATGASPDPRDRRRTSELRLEVVADAAARCRANLLGQGVSLPAESRSRASLDR